MKTRFVVAGFLDIFDLVLVLREIHNEFKKFSGGSVAIRSYHLLFYNIVVNSDGIRFSIALGDNNNALVD